MYHGKNIQQRAFRERNAYGGEQLHFQKTCQQFRLWHATLPTPQTNFPGFCVCVAL